MTVTPPLRIFIGYDSKEPLAYHVLSHSILRRATEPVSITPLSLQQLEGVYTRERGPKESTEFSITRFLVPYLSGYKGHSVFMDCDMLCRMDMGDVWDELCGKAVLVCQHDYTPKTATKFLGQEQTVYPRKNWSSFMIFDNAQCKVLTPMFVNTVTPLELHRFLWLEDDAIGKLPLEWNWLVGEYEKNKAAKILHYTLGGPWFSEYSKCDHAEDWFEEFDEMVKPAPVGIGGRPSSHRIR